MSTIIDGEEWKGYNSFEDSRKEWSFIHDFSRIHPRYVPLTTAKNEELLIQPDNVTCGETAALIAAKQLKKIEFNNYSDFITAVKKLKFEISNKAAGTNAVDLAYGLEKFMNLKTEILNQRYQDKISWCDNQLRELGFTVKESTEGLYPYGITDFIDRIKNAQTNGFREWITTLEKDKSNKTLLEYIKNLDPNEYIQRNLEAYIKYGESYSKKVKSWLDIHEEKKENTQKLVNHIRNGNLAIYSTGVHWVTIIDYLPEYKKFVLYDPFGRLCLENKEEPRCSFILISK